MTLVDQTHDDGIQNKHHDTILYHQQPCIMTKNNPPGTRDYFTGDRICGRGRVVSTRL